MRFNFLAGLLGFLIIIISLQFAYSEAKTICRTVEDGEENGLGDHQGDDMWRRQRASLVIKWFLVDKTESKNTSADSKDPVLVLGDLFNQTIESAVPFLLSTASQQDLSVTPNIRSIDTNITILDESKVESSILLSRKIASVLLKLFNCSMYCDKLKKGSELHKSYYQVHIKNKLGWANEFLTIDHLNPIIVSFDLEEFNRDLDSKIGQNQSCNLCEMISKASSIEDRRKQEDPLTDKVLKVLSRIVSFMEPHHWLALFLGIWLTVCLIIAMLIKRRDKRRLRLYLEERADYSFSAKR